MPRSPSRDLSDRFIGKRGYFRRPDAIRRGKYALAVVAFLASAAWAVVDQWKPTRRVAYSHSHGPLANPHAAFDDNCAACHVAHGISEFSPASIFKARDRWHDLTCEKCHAGPTHHDTLSAKSTEFHNRCSNCHHDHNGRLNSLVRLEDKDCTQCHAGLNNSHVAGQAKYANKVTNFVKDHPEFAPLTQPVNRTLTFSHAIHMNPGQAYSADGKEAMTVGKLRALGGQLAVDRYAPGAKDDDKIQLNCASCHKLDSGTGTTEYDALKAMLNASGEPTKSLLQPRAEGAYFAPVNFEANCRSCHPLNAGEGASGGKAIPGFAVNHRRQPAELLAEVKAGYVKGLVASGHPSLAVPVEPGGKLEPQPKLGGLTLGQEAERLTADAERILFTEQGACAKCHKVTPPTDAKTKPQIAAIADRTVWFTHAKFNHASHRGATCATCHPGTGSAYISKPEADKPEPVQILGVETCKACHAPTGTKVTMPDGSKIIGGGARHACTDCHRYHNGDLPLQGRGADARFARDPLDLEKWLKGN